MNKRNIKWISGSMLIIALLLLAVCRRTISEPSGEHIPLYKYTYNNCGMGPREDFFNVNIVIYEDCKVEIYTDNADLKEDKSEIIVDTEYTIMQSQLDSIYDSIKKTKLYKKNKVWSSKSVCDGTSSYMTFYNCGEELVTLGGYCVSNSKYKKMRELLFQILDMDEEISQIKKQTSYRLNEEYVSMVES